MRFRKSERIWNKFLKVIELHEKAIPGSKFEYDLEHIGWELLDAWWKCFRKEIFRR